MKYVAFFSGGKDSMATIILARENGEPLDEIVFVEVMFDKEISGELPEHINFIRNKCVPIFNKWGYEFKIIRSDITYLDWFNQRVTRSKVAERIGKKHGFPMTGRCAINRDCKMKAINKYLKNSNEDIIEYIGIASNEEKRLKRLSGNKISLLDKYGYNEKQAKDLCIKYGLLSPIYSFSKRGGCWFCPNARYEELRHLWINNKNLFMKLVDLEKTPDIIGNMWNTLNKTSMMDIYNLMLAQDNQISIFDYYI